MRWTPACEPRSVSVQVSAHLFHPTDDPFFRTRGLGSPLMAERIRAGVEGRRRAKTVAPPPTRQNAPSQAFGPRASWARDEARLAAGAHQQPKGLQSETLRPAMRSGCMTIRNNDTVHSSLDASLLEPCLSVRVRVNLVRIEGTEIPEGVSSSASERARRGKSR